MNELLIRQKMNHHIFFKSRQFAYAVRLCFALALVITSAHHSMAQSTPYVRAGWQAPLSTDGHGVSGTVTIVDADTFRVDHFNYDGAGIAVYFYLAAADNRTAFLAGLQTGPNLLRRGNPYVNVTMTVNLPSGVNFDGYNAISVWCTGAGSSFGSGTFVSPLENWRKINFNSNANSGNAANDFDFDQDGHVNLIEYATRSNPKAANTSAWSSPVRVTLPNLVRARQFTFNYRPESRDVHYIVLRSVDMATWTEVYRNDPKSGVITANSSVTNMENPTTQTITVTDTFEHSEAFWRLAVEPTP
jgi:hypothetical protein